MSDSKHADCRRCGGSGYWQYDHNHAQICPDCCPHNQGVWLLTYAYGNAGEWCCKAGCGARWAGIVDYQKRDSGDGNGFDTLKAH